MVLSVLLVHAGLAHRQVLLARQILGVLSAQLVQEHLFRLVCRQCRELLARPADLSRLAHQSVQVDPASQAIPVCHVVPSDQAVLLVLFRRAAPIHRWVQGGLLTQCISN